MDGNPRPAATYPETTSLHISRDGVRISIDGIPSRTNPIGGEAMIPGSLAEELDIAIETIFVAVERYRAQEANSAGPNVVRPPSS
jgi:hypothetical protein